MSKFNLEEQLNRISEMMDKDMDSSKSVVWSKIERGLDSRENKFKNIFAMKNIIKIIAIPIVIITVGVIGSFGYDFLGVGRKVVVEDNNLSNISEKKYSNEEKQLKESKADDASRGFDDDMTLGSAQPTGSEQSTNSEAVEEERAKEKYGNLSLDVEDLDSSVDKVYDLIDKYKAYTNEVNVGKDYATFYIKVPVEGFDKIFQELRELGLEIISEEIRSVDKQEEIDSLDKSIEGIQEQIDELNEKLENATDEVEKEEIRSQIETLESRKNSLEKDLSSVTVETEVSTILLSLNKTDVENESIGNNLQDTVERLQGIGVFWIKAVLWLLTGLVFVSPLLGLGLLVRKFINKRKSE